MLENATIITHVKCIKKNRLQSVPILYMVKEKNESLNILA